MSILTHRFRRIRKFSATRRLVRENRLSVDDLIYPLFVVDDDALAVAVKLMPGIERFNLASLIDEIGILNDLRIPAIALFPVVSANKKSADARTAYDPDGLVQNAVALIKKNYPEIAVITDVALDPYTTHGQDGLVDDAGYVVNDETVEILVKQALSHARAGADIVAPSDMMDGRVGAIRRALEENGFVNTNILAYAAKYASHFYAPFRDAVGSAGNLKSADKKTYQMDFANADEALREVAQDIDEGADIVMVKPGVAYLDIVHRVKTRFQMPTFAYQVSGEYAMLKTAAERQFIDERPAVLEILLAFKRAGADAILTYYAKEAAGWLGEKD